MPSAINALIDIAELAVEDPDALNFMCARGAALLGVPICSIYVRERTGDRRVSAELILRATFGQPIESIGRVKLRVGEGLTGFAVECLRPVTVANAERDARNRTFSGIDDVHHPGLLAVPLMDGGTAVGALVAQRAEARAFDAHEIVLAQVLAVPIVHALERIGAVAPASVTDAQRRPAELSLKGVVAAPGSALGSAMVRERAVAASKRKVDAVEEHARLGRAIAETAEQIAALEAWATSEAPLDRGTMSALLASSRYVLDDARLRARLLRAVQEGLSAERAVEQVIAEYVRALGSSGDAALLDRALEVEALGLRVRAKLDGRGGPFSPGAVLCATRVTACDVLELAANHGVGVVLEGAADRSPGLPIALALGLPVLSEVEGLFRWISDGDRVLLRADEGVIVLNPSRVDVVAYRRQ